MSTDGDRANYLIARRKQVERMLAETIDLKEAHKLYARGVRWTWVREGELMYHRAWKAQKRARGDTDAVVQGR